MKTATAAKPITLPTANRLDHACKKFWRSRYLLLMLLPALKIPNCSIIQKYFRHSISTFYILFSMQKAVAKTFHTTRKEMIFHMNKHSQLKIRGHTK